MFQEYDVIVVDTGHAGCEAAVAAGNDSARLFLSWCRISMLDEK